MSLQESLKLVASIKERIQQEITHHYLNKYIEVPFIDEDRIMLLLNSIVNQEFSKDEAEKLVASAMLIQIALDTHEKVTNFGENIKKRQLLVLSGDYYSGLYYKILAEIDNIPLIKVLASGIKTVNEYKIALYRNEETDVNTYMNNLKNAESAIITNFCGYFGAVNQCSVAAEFLFLNRLLKELELVNNGLSSSVFDSLVKCLIPTKQIPFQQLSSEKKSTILEVCEKYINSSKNYLRKYVKELKKPNFLLAERIKLLVMERQTVLNLYLEEG
ncbi:heptaprenyl diphosphate synthase component 1 [Bacillus sp. FJAT-49736]|uniref:heptaprenyl diphosphate synthase component 1 n=1 Tax=Bacillus sp. FJAT-49736 TaxID=2833582 RepID=UPI001BCA0B97|nr:heptaprenyl diphosphate synthase component 1 [Bacillus sp. FJAT-49736]MBS4173280.1 heptaprenyl diphosphate synthase component 1 [Bacillus sp. FJAT-49736]